MRPHHLLLDVYPPALEREADDRRPMGQFTAEPRFRMRYVEAEPRGRRERQSKDL